MFAPLKRVAALTLAVGSVVFVGCDDVKSGDKAIQENLSKAAHDFTLLDTNSLDPVQNQEAAKQAVSSFKTAADDSSASPIWKATASDAVGQLQLQIANSQMVDLLGTEQKIRQTLAELRSLSQQVSLNSYIINGYKSQNAKQTIESINALVKKMQGDAQNLTWGINPANSQTLRTLAAVNQTISNLEGQITERKGQISSLQNERNAVIGESEAKLGQVEKLKGSEALAMYKDGVTARQKSEEISMKIELETEQLHRLESDLQLSKTETDNLNKGIETLQDQLKLISQSDSEMKDRIAKQHDIANMIAIGEKDDSYTIASKSKTLETLLDEAKAKRTALNDSLTEATKYLDAAVAAGSAANTSLKNPAKGENADAMKKLAESVNANKYNINLGVAHRQLASLSSNHAQLMSEVAATRLMLVNALTSAEVSLNLWPGTDVNFITKLVEDADQELKASSEKLENITSGDASDSLKNAASLARLITMYKQIELANLKNSLSMPIKKEDQDKLVSDAQALKTEILEKHLVLPKIPGELGEMPAYTAVAPTVETPTVEATPDTPEILAVKKAIDDAVTQATAGQFQPVVDMLVMPDYLREGAQPILDLVPTFEKVHQSIVAKFGEDGWKSLSSGEGDASNPQDPAKMLADFRAQLAKAKFKNISETEVELFPETPAPAGKKILFKYVDGSWKLDLASIISEQEAPMLALFGGMASGMKQKFEQLSTDIDAGKYNTIDELKAAMKNLGSETAPGVTPPAGDAPVTPNLDKN